MTPHEELIRAERFLLRALAQGQLRGWAVATIRAALADYGWREPVHQVIFEALLSFPSSHPKIIRDLLPASLTLRGFPDVKLDDLFDPVSISSERVEQLVDSLRKNR